MRRIKPKMEHKNKRKPLRRMGSKRKKKKKITSVHTDHFRERKARAHLRVLQPTCDSTAFLSTSDCLRSIRKMSHQGWRSRVSPGPALLSHLHFPLPCFASRWMPAVRLRKSLERTSPCLFFQDEGGYQKKLSPNQLQMLLVVQGIHACLSIRDLNI